MSSWRSTFNSLKFKLIVGLVITILPLIVILILMNHYSADVVRKQVAQSNKNLLSLYLGQIDRSLQEVDNYLINMSQTNMDLLEIDQPQTMDPNNYTKAKLRLFNTINNDLSFYSSLDMIFIYSEKNDDLLVTQRGGKGYNERNVVAAEIKRIVQDSQFKMDVNRWSTRQVGGEYYAYHIIKTGQVYVGAWMEAGKLIVPLQLINLGSSGMSLLATDEMEPMSLQETISSHGIRLTAAEEPYALTGTKTRYLMMAEHSRKGAFYLFALIPEKTVMEQLPYLQRIASAISLAALLLLVVFIIFMRRVFLLPIYRIIKAMRKLGDGNWNSQIDQYPTSTEFELMNRTYNQMITEIEHLKIHVYEEELNHQRAELKHLQLQINPHFFLNALNIIYNLATVKDYKLIQEMTRCLVEYFRFMFRSNSYLVTLKDELLHTKNYLRIQELRFPGIMSYGIEAPDAALVCMVPPLVIQTFVENVIKHTVDMDRRMHIDVRVGIESGEQGERMVIRIEDTGPGFPEPILRQLQEQGNLTKDEGEHIGIWNVRRRLQLLFDQQASIAFYNNTDGGAGICIRMPVLHS
ncbi:sensor histidine kinase [Paenibacillus puerhi]|uniref:sensor histidine kinase n=1 Tax=Paenibacillus puerhi TaxID=2692622 RepID=UPI00135C6F8D|nr:histidine kinase [Paenibacillus puerhi]